MHARARAYKSASFASEPIQLPIVPVKPFDFRALRSTARARERTDSAGAGQRRALFAAQGLGEGAGAQLDEVGEHAERGWQRAAQLVPIGSAAKRRRLPPHRIGVCARVRAVCSDACCVWVHRPRHAILNSASHTVRILSCM